MGQFETSKIRNLGIIAQGYLVQLCITHYRRRR